MAENNSLSDMTNDGVPFTEKMDNAQVNKGVNRLSNDESNTSLSKLNTNKSMFQRNATIDYARYVTDTKWEEFKKNGDKFTINTGQKGLNIPVSGDKEIGDDGLSVSHLVAWSEKYPAIQLRFQDFVYCKKLGYYPNNRLIVLRRFKHGVPDNLFDYHVKNSNTNSNAYLYTQPLATMVTWLKPDETPLTLTFNEGWEQANASVVEATSQVLPGSSKTDTSKPVEANNFDSAFIGAILQTLGGDFARIDGVDFLGRSIEGNPNLITGAIKRSTGPNKSNLVSSISFPSLSFEYEMRYINNVDPGIAIIDLISNCLRMGTSVSEFKYPIKFLTENENITNLINGEFEINFENFSKKMSEFFKSTEKGFFDTINNIKSFVTGQAGTKAVKELPDQIAKQFISTYRESLKAALAADTGMPSGVWHITIGNPKNPIVSCGDLYVESSKLELGKELGYNDFPTSFTCTYSIKAARFRGRDELERIFNAGRGRVYIYEDWKMNPDYDQYVADTKK